MMRCCSKAYIIICPNCHRFSLVDSSFPLEFEVVNCKCGFDINKTIKQNVEDYKKFTSIIWKLLEKEDSKEISELLDLYNKKVMI